ncbi:MAG: PspC domain-containing protein [Acidimicrobiales bacterium]
MTYEPFPPNPDDPGRQPGSTDPVPAPAGDIGADPGVEADPDPGVEAGAEPGVEADPDLGVEVGTDPDADLGGPMADPPFGPAVGPAPPPPGYVPTRRLVRDPNGVIGGVASGVAHVYGFDVSLVRLVFVLLAFSTGIGLFAYLAAWLIIPRATYWPPVPPPPGTGSALRSRDGLLLAVAVSVALIGIIATSWPGSVMAAVALIGVGIVLLNRAPTPTPVPVQVAAGSTVTVSVSPAVGDPAAPVDPATEPAVVPGPGAPGGSGLPPQDPTHIAYSQPVPPRRRGRGWIVAVILLGLASVAAAALVAVAAFAVRADVSFGDRVDVDYAPATVEELPAVIRHDRGTVTVDLRDLAEADLLVDGRPRSLDIDVGAGRVNVIVPNGVEVDVDADSALGAIDVFDRTREGLRNEVTYTDPGRTELELNIDLGAGDIEVSRG